MWCRTVRKLIYDYVDGMVDGRMAGRITTHLDRCAKCAAAESDARNLTDSLARWEDLPEPADGLHRLETRLAFLPQMPATERPKGKLLTFALPYFAGAASAAAIMLALLPMLRPTQPGSINPTVSPVAVEENAALELMDGEQELTYRDMQAVVDEDGNLIELSLEWQRELERRAFERMRESHARSQPLDGRELGGVVPVDYRER